MHRGAAAVLLAAGCSTGTGAADTASMTGPPGAGSDTDSTGTTGPGEDPDTTTGVGSTGPVDPTGETTGTTGDVGTTGTGGEGTTGGGTDDPGTGTTAGVGTGTGAGTGADTSTACGQGQKLCDDDCVDIGDAAYGCAVDTCAPCDAGPQVNGASCSPTNACVLTCSPDYEDVDLDPSNGCEIKGPTALEDYGLFPNLWLRADRNVQLLEGSLNVEAWTDQSPQAADFGVSMSVVMPDLIEGAMGAYPAVRFDGTDDYLLSTGGNVAFRDLDNVSIFLVVRPGDTEPGARILDLGTGGGADRNDDGFFLAHGADDALEVGWSRGSVYNGGISAGAGTYVPDEVQLYSVQIECCVGSPSISIRRNGVEVHTEPTGSASVPLRVARENNLLARNHTVGAPYFGGDIAEVLVYSPSLDSETHFALVQAYLLAKYGL